MKTKSDKYNSTQAKINRKNLKILMIGSFCNITLYGGMLFIRALYFGGNMRVAIFSILAGLPLFFISILAYIKLPNTRKMPLYLAVSTQLVFLSAGTYLQELDYYFIFMFLVLGITMIMKNFKQLAKCVIIMTGINILAIIFLIPHLEWVNNFRFFVEFLFFLYGASFFLIMTYSVEQKENQAEHSHMAFSSLMHSTPNYMVITDSQNRVRYISKPMAKFAYFSSQSLAVNRPLLDLFSDKKLKLMFADILNAKGFIETVMTIDMDGEERHFRVVADKLSGYIDGNFIDISDITPTINSKQIAEEAQLRAEAASKSKSKFLANTSHEIRTPLNAIMGIAQIEMQKDGLPREYSNALEKIYISGNNLLSIINDILDLSKIETGKLELYPGEYDTASLISDAAQINMVRIGSKQVDFIIEADRNLPSKMYGDELRLRQILNNLLSNAIKYTDKGYVKLSISHSAGINNPEDIKLHITVKDTGQGMKQEDQNKLFSEYQRFNIPANKSTEGAGLGLSITKKLIEMMDGSINVESEYGKGSIFTVMVNQKALECENIGDEISDGLRSLKFTGEKQSEKLKIKRDVMPYGKVLVVDDVETNLYVVSGMLAPYKLKIDMAISGFKTIEMINSGKSYDVIFMDHMMPQMDGMETTQILRMLGYDGAIVALTANALAGSVEMFLKNGFNGFVPKPIDVRILNDILNEFGRDKYPEEAKKYKNEANITTPVQFPALTPKLLEVFRRNALKAAETMRQTFLDDDLKLFTIAAHSMKSALASIGEKEKSMIAGDLEKAGHNGERAFIISNTEHFVNELETLAASIKPAEKPETVKIDVNELTALFAELKPLLEKADFKAIDYVEKLQGIEGLEELAQLIDDYDFEGALEIILSNETT
jgi:signal transduction histidine kinase/CheY-like chemotaxis protein